MESISKKKIIIHYIVLSVCIIAGIAFDQWTKHLAIVNLKEKNAGTVVLWKNILQFTYVENKGAIWGIGQGKVGLFLIAGLVLLFFVSYLYVRIPYKKRYIPMRIFAALLVAGGIGNSIDRLSYGYVVDFLEFGFMDFPVFNVADIYITVAEIFIIVFGLCFYKNEDFEFFSKKKIDTTNKDTTENDETVIDNETIQEDTDIADMTFEEASNIIVNENLEEELIEISDKNKDGEEDAGISTNES